MGAGQSTDAAITAAQERATIVAGANAAITAAEEQVTTVVDTNTQVAAEAAGGKRSVVVDQSAAAAATPVTTVVIPRGDGDIYLEIQAKKDIPVGSTCRCACGIPEKAATTVPTKSSFSPIGGEECDNALLYGAIVVLALAVVGYYIYSRNH
jgi:hypothetical protein